MLMLIHKTTIFKQKETQLTISKILEAAMNEFGINGYFSSPVFQNTDISEKVKMHEMIVSKLLDYMLYGIAQGEK